MASPDTERAAATRGWGPPTGRLRVTASLRFQRRAAEHGGDGVVGARHRPPDAAAAQSHLDGDPRPARLRTAGSEPRSSTSLNTSARRARRSDAAA